MAGRIFTEVGNNWEEKLRGREKDRIYALQILVECEISMRYSVLRWMDG